MPHSAVLSTPHWDMRWQKVEPLRPGFGVGLGAKGHGFDIRG